MVLKAVNQAQKENTDKTISSKTDTSHYHAKFLGNGGLKDPEMWRKITTGSKTKNVLIQRGPILYIHLH